MFSLEGFRLRFPQFAHLDDQQVLAAADDGRGFLADHGCACSEQQLRLMVAHLLELQQKAQAGGVVGQVTGAGVDKVSVSLAPPPSRDMWGYWLSLTGHGQQLQALLKACTAGGLYVGGRSERAAFRAVGGVFPGGGRWRR
ncbi:DUF4054 domain-containing protein [Pseudomonas sp. 21LCFQ010]|uniref:DUF4054 domain-containing protein n=1 Tax=Pseudomonas sp. 21LCFQ010 TaxID=2957506 RepID=UPI0020984952|nr:DUF4054 domain-containing protein [Pseudomonas sp. 21LCFQ010]MCO8160972.1 DUF4054 domain-containing protein [Pseudomonas sp. 21LCFQ010]